MTEREHNDGSFAAIAVATVRQACRGDRDALALLWNTHRRWLAVVILAHRPGWVDLEDLMQDVAVKLVDRIGELRDPGAFRPWLRQIAVNECRLAARNRRTTTPLASVDGQAGDAEGTRAPMPASTHDGPVAIIERSDEAMRLLDHALSLPTDYREPLLLRCVRGMSYQQIGELLDLPVTTIETRIARARRMLREEMQDEGQLR
jgi:RNA polymerase sigma-70 factor, ECF subfamily